MLAESAKKRSLIRGLKTFGLSLRLKGTSFFSRISIVLNAVRLGARTGKRAPKMIGDIKDFGDISKVEILLPSFIAKWLEEQAKLQKMSVSMLIKSWIMKAYNSHVQRVSKR